MQFYEWEVFVKCHHPDKSCDPKHFDSEDIGVLIFHVTSPEHML